jgi:RecA-family ATPase
VGKGNGGSPPKPTGITAAELLSSALPEIHPLCEPWLYEGVTILAGAPKSGKTTLLRQIAEAVGTEEGAIFGSPCEHGRVCFLSLEEGPRLFRRKLQSMGIAPEAASMIDVFFQWPQGLAGCDLLHEHIVKVPDTRLVCIDVFAAFRQPVDKVTNQYQSDYDAMTGLSTLGKLHPGLAIAASLHTRKMRSVEAMDDISGTYGLTAAADAFLVLRKQGAGGTLHAGGRLWDRDDNDFELSRKNQRWHLNGVSDGLADSERYTLDVVTKTGGVGPTELAKLLNCTRQAAYQRLDALLSKGKVEKSNGIYISITTT